MFEIFRLADRLVEFRQQILGDDQQPGAAVAQHEAVIVLGHQRIDRDRDHAGLDRAEERGRPVDGVEQTHQHALLAADAQRAQHVAEALGALGEIGIAVFAAMIDEGDLAGAAGIEIALENVGGEIVVARDRGHGRRRIRRHVRRAVLRSDSHPGVSSP